MKKICIAALAAVSVLYGCTKENLSGQGAADTGYHITLAAEKVDNDILAKASINLDNSKIINWDKGDEISVFDGAGVNCKFTLTEGAGTPLAKFEGTVTKPATSYTALYPYQADATILIDGSLVELNNVTFKSEQKAVIGSFDPEAAIMVAKTKEGTNILQYRNMAGFIKFVPKSDCNGVSLLNNDSEYFPAEHSIITMFPQIMDGEPTLTGGGGAKSVSIRGDIKAGNTYYIAVGPFYLGKGFSLAFDMGGYDTFKRTDKTIEIVKNKVINLGEVEGLAESYIKFTADAAQSFNMSPLDSGKYEYSVGSGDWSPLTSSMTIAFGGETGDLKLRGKNSAGTWSAENDSPGIIRCNNNGPKVHCTGDIRTLIDWENYKTVDTGNAIFRSLFFQCEVLVTAPELPATKLAKECYKGMFEGCTSLIYWPELPAVELSEGCYAYMFSGCTSLKESMWLPAQSVPSWAYASMFQGCTSIEYTDKLPAEQVSSAAYYQMYSGCSSLTTMPEISATCVEDASMKEMFANCSKLTSATELHLTSLAEECCMSMFSGCSSLAAAPSLPDTAPTKSCYESMFAGCTSLKNAPKIPSGETAIRCYFKMFANSGIGKAPDLPAENIATQAYLSMFERCTSLTAMPEISAVRVDDSGMWRMFAECNNLKTSTDLNVKEFADSHNCYQMFYNCTSLTSAPALPATKIAPHCYYNMFGRCTNLVTGPAELPATELENYCYGQMFRSCSNLKTAPKLPATTLKKQCYIQMFQNCSSLEEAPELPARILSERSCQSMFSNCTSLTSAPALKFDKTVEYCCPYMFEGCSQLKDITIDVTDIADWGAFEDWLNKTAAEGKLHIRAGLDDNTKNNLHCPDGWTMVEDVTGF